MQQDRLRTISGSFRKLKIGVVGDFCIDAYWLIDRDRQEISVETGKPTRPVQRQSYSLGGAGNVVTNLAALGAGEVWAFGVVGDDLFGREMLTLLSTQRARTDGIITQSSDWDTPVYAKPHIALEEQERIDFGNFNTIQPATIDCLLRHVENALPDLDGLIINQQLVRGIHSEYMIAKLNTLIDRFSSKIILLDARHFSDRYDHVICKINASEAAKLCGVSYEVTRAISVDEISDFARQIHRRTSRPVIITRSDRGIVAYDGRQTYEVPGILVMGQTDPVGAGDTAASAIVCALSTQAGLDEAIEIGNYAAGIVVQKLRQTGTASPEELLATANECDYVYRPDLAEDIRKACFWQGSEIEIVSSTVELGRIKHVIFDHDGTISTLRQGWEQIMEPVMVHAILGSQYLQAPEELYHRVLDRVRKYIDQSTGIETIVQMQALVEMVKQFGLVDPQQVLDPMGYKQIYNQALMETVNRRSDKLSRHELETADYTMKGAVQMLEALHNRGVVLYLASGTDHDDVLREANILGYAKYFTGGIYGWAGQGSGSVKRIVIEQIIREHKLQGCELACFGDGPVELRLCKKANGVAVAISSDEVRRYGSNPAKRSRLIKAGADILVPDYSQRELLLDLLFNTHRIRPQDLCLQ